MLCPHVAYACINIQDEGAWGHAPPGNFLKLDALRLLLTLLLRPFWDRSRAVVATWPTEYCIQFLDAIWYNIYAFAKPADIEFHERRYTVGRTADGVKDGEIVRRY